MNFSLNTFLVSISGVPFVFTEVRILLSVCKLNKSTKMWILIKHRIIMTIKMERWCLSISRSSHRRCSVKKVVLKNFANFTEKHLCWSLFLITFHAFRPTTLLKRLQRSCFPVKFAKVLRTPILKNICERLLCIPYACINM